MNLRILLCFVAAEACLAELADFYEQPWCLVGLWLGRFTPNVSFCCSALGGLSSRKLAAPCFLFDDVDGIVGHLSSAFRVGGFFWGLTCGCGTAVCGTVYSILKSFSAVLTICFSTRFLPSLLRSIVGAAAACASLAGSCKRLSAEVGASLRFARTCLAPSRLS